MVGLMLNEYRNYKNNKKGTLLYARRYSCPLKIHLCFFCSQCTIVQSYLSFTSNKIFGVRRSLLYFIKFILFKRLNKAFWL